MGDLSVQGFKLFRKFVSYTLTGFAFSGEAICQVQLLLPNLFQLFNDQSEHCLIALQLQLLVGDELYWILFP